MLLNDMDDRKLDETHVKYLNKVWYILHSNIM